MFRLKLLTRVSVTLRKVQFPLLFPKHLDIAQLSCPTKNENTTEDCSTTEKAFRGTCAPDHSVCRRTDD
jgi:hypothetical protein